MCLQNGYEHCISKYIISQNVYETNLVLLYRSDLLTGESVCSIAGDQLLGVFPAAVLPRRFMVFVVMEAT
jgi:hypothetical protein